MLRLGCDLVNAISHATASGLSVMLRLDLDLVKAKAVPSNCTWRWARTIIREDDS